MMAPVSAVAALALALAAFDQPASDPAPSSGRPPDGGSSQPVPFSPPPPPQEPGAEATAFAPRDGVLCADFKAAPGARWQVLAPITIPGPQGPIRLAAGQVVAPGAYVSGFDLGAVLQARCR